MWSWNQFRNLPKNQGLSAQEQARQYFIHQSNMMMEASFNNAAAAAASSAAAGAGAGAGGGTPASRRVTTEPVAIKISAKNNTIGYYDETDTQNLVFFNADWDSVSFSDTANSGIPYVDISNWYFDEMIDGKGVLVRVNMNNSDRYYIFIDAGCNIIETVHLVFGSTYGAGANRRSSEGLVIQLSYRNESGRIVKWWNGDKIFTHTDTSINSNTNSFSLDYYGYDSAFGDGTTSVYIYDQNLEYTRVFHCRPDGQFLEVTSSLRINGTSSQEDSLHCIGNFTISTFQFDTPNLFGTASYSESFEVTLTAPITGLRRGMQITGADFTQYTLVTAISNDGLTITISQLPDLANNDSPVEFIGNFLDTLRVTLVDGSYTDFDISEYDSAYTVYDDLFGSDKAFLSLFRAFDGSVVHVIYNHSTGLIHASDPTDSFDYTESYNANIKKTFYSSVESVAGCEKFLGASLGSSNYDGKMYRYEDLTFIWSNSTGEIFTYTFDTSVDTIGFNPGYGYGDPMYVVINSPESTNLEIMRFNDNGTISITSLGTNYSDWSGYLQYSALGDKTWISWKDALRDGGSKIQAFAVFAGATGPADQIWVTQNNNGDQIGKTQFISQFDEGVTYLFNYTLNEYYTISDLIDTWTQFRWNSYQNAINFEQLSNVALFPPDNSFYLVNPSYTPPVRVDDGGYLELRGSSDYAVKLSEDDGPDGFTRISVYDYEGTLVNSVLTQATGYEDFEVVNERIFLSQNPTGDTWHFYIVTPNEDGYVFKEITAPNGIQYWINSWGWWD